jgi:hypothetical protein
MASAAAADAASAQRETDHAEKAKEREFYRFAAPLSL